MPAGVLGSDVTSELGAIDAPIANGESISGVVDLKAGRAHRVNIPGWTAADMTFQISDDGVTFYDLFNSTGEVKIASAVLATAAKSVLLDFPSFYGIRWLKIRSGVSGAAVNQGSARAITISTVPR